MTDKPYLDQLLEPEQHDLTLDILRSLPKKVIAEAFRSYYRKAPAEGIRILNAKIKKIAEVRAEDILAAFDRLLEKEKKYLTPLLETWLKTYGALLEQIENQQTPDETVPANILALAYRLVKPTGQADQTVFLQRLSLQNQRIEELEQALKTGQVQNRQLEQTGERRELARKDIASQLAEQKSKLEQAFLRRQEQEEDKHKRQLQQQLESQKTETKRLQDKIKALQNELIALGQDKQKIQTEASQKRAEISKLQTEKIRLADALQEKTQALARSEQAQTQMREDSTQQREKAESNEKKRMAEMAQREQTQKRQVGGAELKNALLIDYRHLAIQPSNRLLLLLELYKAFLKHDKDHLGLQQHSNYADFKNPSTEIRGILILGMEQLLLDAVNLPLVAWLHSQSFQQETVLKQLLEAIESPRIQGAA